MKNISIFLLIYSLLFSSLSFAVDRKIQADIINPSISGNAVNLPKIQVDNLNLDSNTAKTTSGDLVLDAAGVIKPNQDLVPNQAGLDLGSSGTPFQDIHSIGEHFGLKIENVTSGTIPASDPAKKGRLVYTTDTKKLYVDDGSAFIEAGGSGGGISEWLTTVTYVVDDIVHTNNKIYKALVGHTAGTFATDLAAAKWVELSADSEAILTKGQSEGSSVSTTEVQAPYNQFTTVASGVRMIESGSENMLVNPGFEAASTTGWTCTVGTCTVTSTSGEFSSGKQALKVALSAQAMNVSQTITTPLGIQKQGVVRVVYRVPSTMADFQVCSLVDSIEQSCVPSANLILDDAFHSIEIPTVFGSTSAGIKFKTTTPYTGNAFFDAAALAQGVGFQSFKSDVTYSAKIQTSTGNVSNLSHTGWITCSAANPSVCTFASGIFTVPPSCVASPTENYAAGVTFSSTPTATGFAVNSFTTSTGVNVANLYVAVDCTKSGKDYLAASAQVYSASNSKKIYASYWRTSTTQTLSSLTPICYDTKIKDDFGVITFTSGATCNGTTSDWKFTAPKNGRFRFTYGAYLDADTNVTALNVGYKVNGGSIIYINGVKGTQDKIQGTAIIDMSKGDYFQPHVFYSASSGSRLLYTGYPSAITVEEVPETETVTASFVGVPTVPKTQKSTEIFQVSYGATATTNCTTPSTNCAYQDNLQVVGVERGGSTGLYNLSFYKTFSTMKCSFDSNCSSASIARAIPINCTNCSSASTTTVRTDTNAACDSWGTITCIGTY